jgi:hypothetical protein
VIERAILRLPEWSFPLIQIGSVGLTLVAIWAVIAWRRRAAERRRIIKL